MYKFFCQSSRIFLPFGGFVVLFYFYCKLFCDFYFYCKPYQLCYYGGKTSLLQQNFLLLIYANDIFNIVVNNSKFFQNSQIRELYVVFEYQALSFVVCLLTIFILTSAFAKGKWRRQKKNTLLKMYNSTDKRHDKVRIPLGGFQ